MKKMYFFAGCILLYAAAGGFAQSNFNKGEELLMQNKPKEALPYLENSVADDSAHAQAFLYLGIVYEQLDRPDEAIAAYRKILPRAGNLSAYVASNLGNAYYRKGSPAQAEQFYSQAIDSDPVYASAYLGRANSRVKSGSLRAAVVDYELYLSLEPGSAKRPQIERLIAFIREEFAAEERRKLLAEEAARAEAERKQRLLEEVSASLQSAAEGSQGLSTGAEDVLGYEGEFELE
ncbi:MAG: tetratricopeptide repeat protein [Treponema sp.]|jgi:tetratricopeptide (TPR) repeat protein|nr:tetratricopeptide repeat protein [Treponema sp.]